MKRIVILVFLGVVSSVFGQRLSFNITNDSIDNEFYLTKINSEILETITIESFNFNVDINFEDGYYFLEKEDEKALLYLKKNDEFTISFDANNFQKSLSFSGKRGAGRNTYIHSKSSELLDKDGIPVPMIISIRMNELKKLNEYSGQNCIYF